MPEPQYPTKEGLWSNGRRKEEGYARVRLGFPYGKAVDNLRRAARDREDFDSAVLFVWGTMQATAVLNVLKAAEEQFGEAGQIMVRKSLNAAGYEAARGMLENSDIPDDLEETELMSFLVTGINTILYASLERPWITNADRCEFDILWCPHQDRYTAFDCRVQRFFVEGMIRACEDFGYGRYAPTLEKLIPRGADCCHFVVDRWDGRGQHPWDRYSEELQRRAFEKQKASDK